VDGDPPPGFEWDPAKRSMSERKPNRPTFPVAATAFRDAMALENPVAGHSAVSSCPILDPRQRERD
jgi:hypothetical protein